MTQLQTRFKQAFFFSGPWPTIIMSLGAGATLGQLWAYDLSNTELKVIATGWFFIAWIIILWLKVRRAALAYAAADQEHKNGYIRGVGAMMIAYHEFTVHGNADRMETVMTAAQEELIDWRDDWRMPQSSELSRINDDE